MERDNTVKICLSCKITSVCCLCGIGGYFIHTAKTYRNNSKILHLLALGIIGLGIGEIFDRSPFRTYQK
ncbi:hypothetical protein JTB14_033679 [Gonioctena quinquepunctata]|nr:hypothetical protein JTB14_033679 [Gonioctena quinquepunctata]